MDEKTNSAPPAQPISPPPETATASAAARDQCARLEKLAATHFDRAVSLSAGTTKTALAWTVALALVWFQILEHRLNLVRYAQQSRNQFTSVTAIPAGVLGADRLEDRAIDTAARLRAAESAESDQTIDLPFSVKLTLPPHWIPTLWLLLALGLTFYLDQARRRIFRLIGRGIRLHTEAGVEDARFRTLVGGGVWWLAPIAPAAGQGLTTGEAVGTANLKTTLDWPNPRRKTAAVACVAAILFLVQARVQYISLCVTGRLLLGTALPELLNIRTLAWLALTMLNLALGSCIAMWIWRWFDTREQAPALAANLRTSSSATRRRMLALGVGGSFGFFGFFSNLAAIFGFASAHAGTPLGLGGGKDPAIPAFPHRKRGGTGRHAPSPPLPYGLYLNPKTGVVHISAPAPKQALAPCASCIRAAWAARLKRIDPTTVQWNRARWTHQPSLQHPAVTASLPSQPKPPSPPKITPRPHTSHRTFMVERQAIAYLTHTDPKKAIDFLLQSTRGIPEFGIQSGLRNYDLLAGLAVRYGQTKVLESLTDILKDELTKMASYHLTYGSIPAPRRPQPRPWLRVLLALADLDSFARFASPSSPQRNHLAKPRRNPRKSEQPQAPPSSHDAYLMQALNARLQKWSDPENAWLRRWKNPAPIPWAGTRLPPLHKT